MSGFTASADDASTVAAPRTQHTVCTQLTPRIGTFPATHG